MSVDINKIKNSIDEYNSLNPLYKATVNYMPCHDCKKKRTNKIFGDKENNKLLFLCTECYKTRMTNHN